MEVVFFVGMIVWGFYLLVNEDIEDVKRDFGIEEQGLRYTIFFK